MMQNELFKQLDLNIDAATRVYWWQHPAAQAMLVGILLVTVAGVIIWHRRRRVVPIDTIIQQLINVLHESMTCFQNSQITEADVLLTISAVLKRYTAWLVHDSSIGGMTDQEWVVFIKKSGRFDGVLADCEQLVAILDRYKFSGQIPEKSTIGTLFESAYAIMAKTSAGRIPEHAGCFIARLKQDGA